jgi:integrase
MKIVQPIRDKDKIEELKAILRRQSGRNYFLFAFGINTGLRISDILPLKVKDVRDRGYVILIEQKTKKIKRFKINYDLKQIIDEYIIGLKDDELLFPSGRTGLPISRIHAYRILNEAATLVGLEEIGTHTLRKTFGYHFYQKTRDTALLQELFNHATPAVTLRYIGVNQDNMDKAMEDFSL